MKLHYYPGCTLKQKTTALDISTREAMKRLDIELVEPEGWTCCGAEYPLTEEKIIGLAAPIRTLRQVREEGGDVVVTTCSFCYAVLKRANKAIQDDPLKRKRVNAYPSGRHPDRSPDQREDDGLRGLQRRGQGPPPPGVPARHGRLSQDPRAAQEGPRGPGRRPLLRLPSAPAAGGDGRRRARLAPRFRGLPGGCRAAPPSITLSSRNAAVPISPSPCPQRPRRPLTASFARRRMNGAKAIAVTCPSVLLQHGPPPGGHQGGLPGFLGAAGPVLHPDPGLGAGGRQGAPRPRGAHGSRGQLVQRDSRPPR